MADVLNETLQGVTQLRAAIDLLKVDLKELVTESKKVTKELKLGNLEDFKTLEKQIKLVALAEKELIKIEKEDVKLKKEQEVLLKQKQQTLQQAEKTEKQRIQTLREKKRLDEQVRKELARQEAATKKVARANEKLNSIYSRESKRLNDLRKKYKDLILTEGKATNETRKLRNEIQNLDRKLKRADADVGQFQRSVGNYKQALAGSLGTVGQFATGVGAISAGVMLAGRAIGSAVNIIKEFEQANANLQAVLGKTREEMQPLIDQAKALGASTAFSATEVIGLSTEFAKLGFPIQDIQKMTASTLDASAAMGSDLAAQAALTGSTLKAFGLQASDTQRVNDVLAKSTSASALDFEKLNSSMSTIAPVAKKFGFSLEGSVSLLGELSNAGFDASSAATATRNIMLNLADSSSKLSKRLKEPVKDLPSLVAGLKQLKGEGVDLGEALELTDKRSVAAFATFLDGTDSVLELNKALKGAQGTAAEMAAIQLDTLDGSLKILNSSWEGLILSFEDGSGVMNDIATRVVQDLSIGLSVLSGNFDAANDKLSVFTLWITAIKNGFTLMIGVLKLLTTPWRVFFNLVEKLGQKFGIINKGGVDFEKILLKIQKVFIRLPEIMDIVFDGIIKGVERVSDVFFALGELIEGSATGNVEKMKSGAIRVAQAVDQGIDDIFKGIPDKIKALFKIDFPTLGAGILDGAKKMGEDTGSEFAKGIKKGAKKEFETLDETIGKGFDELLESRRKRSEGQQKEITSERISDFNESKNFDQLKLDSAIESVNSESALKLKIARERNQTALEQDKLTANDRTRIIEEGAEIERQIEKETLDKIDELNKAAIAKRKADLDAELEAEKKRVKELEDQLKNRTDLILQGIDKGAQAQRKAHAERLKQFDEQIARSRALQKSLAEDARQGVSDAKENLVFAREAERKAQQERIAETKRQERIEKGLAFTKLVISNAGNPEVKQPILKSIGQFAAMEAFIGALTGLYTGTDNTGETGQIRDQHGPITGYTHRNEVVFNSDETDKMKSMGVYTRDSAFDLMEAGQRALSGELMTVTRKQQELHITNKYESNTKMLSKMDDMIEANKNAWKKVKTTQITAGDVIDIAKEVISENGKTQINKYRKGGIHG